MANNGKVALVGAGPGDEGLLTVRGLELIKQADCIVFDRLLNKRFLEYAKDGCELIYVGKENHHHTMKQDDINDLLFTKSCEYELVVRLKGGDPYVFGRGGEEALFLKERGAIVEVVPGISSSVAAAALAGIPLTHRGLSKGFLVITAHNQKDALSEINFSLLTDEDITLVFLMGLSHVADIAKGLIDAGRSATTPAAVISCGTTADQKKSVGTLGNIAELVEKDGLISPSIIVVGKVVSLSGELSFFESRPLFGKKFFLPEIKRYPETSNELEKKLIEAGADVVTAVAGKIVPLRMDSGFLQEMKEGDYIAFTSASGVNAFFYNLFEVFEKDIRAIAGCRFAVIGDKTAQELFRFGIRADIVSTRATAKDFADMLVGALPDSAQIYWMCGKRHSAEFEEILSPRICVHKIICYENVRSEAVLSDEDKKNIEVFDGTILTSGSNARFACEALDKLPGVIYSIGPSCTETLRKCGVTGNIVEAKGSSYEGLLDTIIER